MESHRIALHSLFGISFFFPELLLQIDSADLLARSLYLILSLLGLEVGEEGGGVQLVAPAL